MEMLTPQKALEKVSKDELFLQWNKLHSQNYLSHLFCSLSANITAKSNWEIGFFDKETNKITVFVLLDEDKIMIKPADDVFKKDEMIVEKLKMEEVKVSLDEAAAKFKENCPLIFPKEILGDGFLVLQTFQQKTLWNFTFITKTLKFVNLKMDTSTGEVDSSNSFSVIDQENK